jgi:hypothetical protein
MNRRWAVTGALGSAGLAALVAVAAKSPREVERVVDEQVVVDIESDGLSATAAARASALAVEPSQARLQQVQLQQVEAARMRYAAKVARLALARDRLARSVASYNERAIPRHALADAEEELAVAHAKAKQAEDMLARAVSRAESKGDH